MSRSVPVPRIALRAEPLLAGGVALAAAALIVALGPAPGDAPAHLYRTLLVQRGDLVWDNLWFGGNYPLASYSLLYYFPAAVVGNLTLLLLSSLLCASLFAAICIDRWGAAARWPARLGGVLAAAPAFTGLYPYSLGLVAMLGALRTLQRGRTAWFALLAALTLGLSPLAFVFLLVILASAFGQRPRLSRRALAVAAVALGLTLVEVVLLRLFPAGGIYPFHPADFGCLLGVCCCGVLLGRRSGSGQSVSAFFVSWAAVSVVAFVLPSPIGDNITRLRGLVLPVMVIAATQATFRPRWLVAVALAGAAAYNLVPYLMLIPYRLDTRPEHRSFWAPALTFLAQHSSADYRVEVVETAANWESYWFPREGFPIVRGWYRQLDEERNPVLYKAADAAAYRAWLERVGARYVVLPDTRLDPLGGDPEAGLVRRSRSWLRLVLRAPTLSVFEVRRPTPILTGPAPAELERVTPGTISGRVTAPGTYRLRVQATPYLQVRAGAVCIGRARDGQVRLVAHAPGRFELAVPENPLDLIDAESRPATRC